MQGVVWIHKFQIDVDRDAVSFDGAPETAPLSAPLLLPLHRLRFLGRSSTATSVKSYSMPSVGGTSGRWPAASSPMLAQNSIRKLPVQNNSELCFCSEQDPFGTSR